jgi:hypothetical protein
MDEAGRVTIAMRVKWLLLGLALAIVALLAFAWIDGGREPVRTITVPVALPGGAQ